MLKTPGRFYTFFTILALPILFVITYHIVEAQTSTLSSPTISTPSDTENQVRKIGFSYYSGTLFGDATDYFKAVKSPVQVMRDGVITVLTEKKARTMLESSAQNITKAGFTEEERKRLSLNMLAVFEGASIQFIGANTATITFLIRPDAAKGDSMGVLVLIRKAGLWQVIEEITDSVPVPASYLK